MVNAGFADLIVGIMALEIFFFLDPQSGAGTTAPSAQAPLLYSALELLLPLGVAGVFTAVAYIYHHLSRRHAAVPAAGAANGRLSGVAIFILCVSVGVLDFFFFYVQPPPGGVDVDHGARARALGLAAHHARPAAATATFFLGMMLIFIAHVRAGGEGSGGGAGAGAAGHGEIHEGGVRILTRIAVGAAAGLVLLVTVAFGIKY